VEEYWSLFRDACLETPALMYEFDDLTMPYSDDAFEEVSRLLACRPATESTTSGNATKAEPKSNDVQGKVLTRFNKRKVLSPVELV